MNNHVLAASNVTAGYDSRAIISGIDLTVPKNKINVIIGANGCGKSTLLKTFSRLIRPYRGQVMLNGKAVSTLPAKQAAKIMGLLPQSPTVPEGIKVTDLVTRGRFPYRRLLKSMTGEDFKAVEEAMDIMGITELADRSVDELSGGQRQRVWIALALAQQTDILLLDEPTTFLDISYQVEILDLLTDLNRRRGTTIIMVLHDINLSARYADYLFAMRDGSLAACGTPHEIITPELIKDIYGLDCIVMEDPVSTSPFIIPMGRHHSQSPEYGTVPASLHTTS